MTPSSARPGSATISRTRRRPSVSVPTCTTRSTLAATVGTTNAVPMFSPASRGSVHIFTTASRALLACNVHMPGRPEFRAIRRSRHSSWRTSPTTIREGRIRSASLTSRRSGISPVPSRFAWRVCMATTSGSGTRSSKTSSLVTYTCSGLRSGDVRAAISPGLSKDRSGISPNVVIQQLECEEYAQEHGWEVVGIFADNDISASRYSTKPRHGYQELLHAIRGNRVDVVLCTEVSRLYRRIDELIELIKLAEHTRLRRIETTDGNGYDLSTGEGIHNAISAVNNAQLESRKISDRSKRKKKAMARSGLFGGGRRPFGYDYISATRTNQGQVLEPGRLVPNMREAQAIKEAATRITGGSSVRSVALWLNDEGLLTTLGNRWTPFNLKRLLLSRTLLGIRTHRTLDPQTHQPVTQEHPGTWPAILDEVTHERLRIVLNDEAKLLGMDKRQ